MSTRYRKVILITGASSGIGRATAIRLNKAGYLVIAAARRVDRMKDLREQGMHVIPMDVTDEESMMRGINEIVQAHGRIDILINNAGYGSYGALGDVPIDEARRQFEVNIFGMARLTQLVLPYMRENRFGRIINISSIGGKIHEPLGVWYHATKFAVEGLSDCLRVEVAPFGIDVVVIEPGAINTEWPSIAADHLVATSGSGAYAGLAKERAAFLRSQEPGGSDPDVIAKGIQKAIQARRPKTRYALGKMAKPAVFMRWLLSDRMMDKVVSGLAK